MRVAEGPLRCAGGGFWTTRKALLSLSCLALVEPFVSAPAGGSGSVLAWAVQRVQEHAEDVRDEGAEVHLRVTTVIRWGEGGWVGVRG